MDRINRRRRQLTNIILISINHAPPGSISRLLPPAPAAFLFPRVPSCSLLGEWLGSGSAEQCYLFVIPSSRLWYTDLTDICYSYSKRMQIALVLGFMLNLTFGTWTYLIGG